MSRWEQYSFRDDRVHNFSHKVYKIEEGTPSPWNVRAGAYLPHREGSISADHRRLSNCNLAYDYKCLIDEVAGIRAWERELAQGKLPPRLVMHDIEFIKLERNLGDAVYEGRRVYPRYYCNGVRSAVRKHWVMPAFISEGHPYRTLWQWEGCADGCDVETGCPPRIYIREMVDASHPDIHRGFVVDVVADSYVFAYGKYLTFDSAKKHAQQLIMDIMITPEEVPSPIVSEFNRPRYGYVYRGTKPIGEQMRLSDYHAALVILTADGSCTRADHTPSEAFREMLWKYPATAIHDIIWHEDMVRRCYGGNDYDLAQASIKKLLPYLKGPYTRHLRPIFEKALRLTETEYNDEGYGHDDFGRLYELGEVK